jgi:uncharacterized protein with ParB-like and HNH nuclease domain/predicted transport protein
MEANKSTLFQLLNGEKQFRIPIYQRTYSWEKEACERLIDDILAIADAPEGQSHFLGSVVYVAQLDYQVAGVNSLLVIDGQQRLTTLSLLILALRKRVSDGIDIGVKSGPLGNYYLFNANEDENDDRYIKLELTQSDRDIYRRLCFSAPPGPKDQESRVKQNFDFFVRFLESGDPQRVYRGIQRLQIVYIALEKGKDNPQLIFESMNSTGLSLAQADLVRNYVLMGLDHHIQTSLYNKFWFPMERIFGEQYREEFDAFMRTYLTVRRSTIPKEDRVYAESKRYVLERPQAGSATDRMESLVSDLHENAIYYARFARQEEDEPELKIAFKDFGELRADVAHPFFLELYSDYKAGQLSCDDLLKIVRLTESYVMRRALCGIPTNGMNKTFAGLTKNIDKSDYWEAIQRAFMALGGKRKFPRDEEVKKSLEGLDAYNFARRNYLLERLENSYHPKEPLLSSNGHPTVEHIMPQKLSQEWELTLGVDAKVVHATYLHNLGNITWSGYNAELGALPFLTKVEKEPGGYSSGYFALNKYVAVQSTWGREQIEQRCAILADQVCMLWKAPEDRFAPNESPVTADSYTLDHYSQLKGSILELYLQLERGLVSLRPNIRRVCRKQYIALKLEKNLLTVIPQASQLLLFVDLELSRVEDTRGICKAAPPHHWGTGNVEISLYDASLVDYVISIVQQAAEG